MRAVTYQAASLALLAAAAVGLPAGPAHAERAHRAWAELHLAYDRAEVSKDRHQVAYDFVVSNEGRDAAADVLVVHEIRPWRHVEWASWPCQVHEEAVSCAYGRLRAGHARTGRIVVGLRQGTRVPDVLGRASGWETRTHAEYRQHTGR